MVEYANKFYKEASYLSTQFVPDETENKLILLFILDKMEIPLTENSIMDIATSRNNWLSYMDCKK